MARRTRLFFGQITGVTPPATAVTLNGPAGGVVGFSSTNFNVGVDHPNITGTLVVTPATDVSGGGSFAPTTVSLTTASPSGTFTFTPAKSGVHQVSVTNDGGLTNPSAVTYTVTPVIAVILVTSPSDSTPRTNLTNLLWAWWDQIGPYAKATHVPTDVGNTGTTDGVGNFQVSMPNSVLTNGQSGSLEVWDDTSATNIASAKVAVT